MSFGPDPTRDALDQTLSALVRDQRQWIARDPVRVRTLLQHTYQGSPIAQSREAEAAVQAIQFGVFDLLNDPNPAAVEQLVQQVSSQGGVTPDEARWAVHSWARAAGVSLGDPGLAGTVPVTPPPPATPAPIGYADPAPPPAGYPAAAAAGPATGYLPPNAAPAGPGYPPPGVAPGPAFAPSGPPGSPPVPPGSPGPYGAAPPPASSGSKAALVIGLVALVVLVLIVGVVGFALSRRNEVAQDPIPVPTLPAPGTAAPGTTTAPSSTDTDPATTRRTTTTRRSTTTDTPATDPPTVPPPEWSTFVDPAGKYSIDFPGSPKLSMTTTDIEGHDVGIFDYSVDSRGNDYELAVAELPPGYVFTNPQDTLENVVGSAVSSNGGSVVARDSSPFAGNPALFLDIKGASEETNVFGLISGNRIYVMVVSGEDLTTADFPRFRSSFQIH